jgi:ferric-dicitrate binding protein FerR (iron transport regulator)
MLNDAEKYQQFEAEDFAADEDFLTWVLSGKQATAWEAWLNQNTDKQKAVAKAKALVSLMRNKEKEISNENINNLWSKIDMATQGAKASETKVIPFYQTTFGRVSVAVAASITLLLGFFWFNQSTSSYQTGTGERLAVTLPDGSIATLNAASSISFNTNTWADNREVMLEGEAFFEVEKGERFTVKTGFGEVTVLGTSFNVQQRNDLLQVACFTGKVGVKNQFNVSQTLTPGKRIMVDKGEAKLDNFIHEQTIAWKRGVFRFDDIPLALVLDELQRQYKIEVQIKTDISNRKYSGSFTKGDLDGALKMICLPMELSYKIAEDNGLVVIDQE